MDTDSISETERLRVEAIAAFAHEIRTPITSLKMLVELARRHGEDGGGKLDAELMGLLQLTADELTSLVDEAQRASRLMRGSLQLQCDWCSLAAVIARAREMLPAGITFSDVTFEDVHGWWDAGRFAHAIAQMAVAVDRLGRGDGNVEASLTTGDGGVMMTLQSGIPGGSAMPVNADAGFGFFVSRQILLAMGANLAYDRAEGFALSRFHVSYGRENP